MTASPTPSRSAMAAHIWPMGLFIGFLALSQVVASLGSGSGIFLLAEPKYWIFPLQTLVCAGALVYFWKEYDFGASRWLLSTSIGILALVVWIFPQSFLGASPRLEGFDPTIFEGSPLLYWLTLSMRFLRLVVLVPLVEEIFWRGFLMRYLVNKNFESVRFGTFTPQSFFGVAFAFTLVHAPADWPAAFVTGLLFGWVAVRGKSLLACVLAHAVTNLILGAYIVITRQWGFW